MTKIARYTMMLGDIIRGYGSDEVNINAKIDKAREYIFSFDYPMYNEEHRADFERKFLKHFFTYELGSETFALWQLRLDERLNLIMPKYEEIFSSDVGEFRDELFNVDMKNTSSDNETYTHHESANDKSESKTNAQVNELGESETTRADKDESKNTSKTTDTHTGTVGTSGTSESKKVLDQDVNGRNTQTNSDFPQARIDRNTTDYASDESIVLTLNNTDSTETGNTTSNQTVTNNLTDVSEITGSATSEKTGQDSESHSSNTTNDSLTTNKGEEYRDSEDTRTSTNESSTKGFNGNRSKMELAKIYREAVINIDEMIFNDCKDLFMLIFDNTI